MNWHTRPFNDVLQTLTSDARDGLSDDEAARRLTEYGSNELQEQAGKHPLSMLWEQFTSTMVLILIAAAVISGFLGKPLETAAISAIVVLFAVLGFLQEYRAERAMAALKQMTVPDVLVRRSKKIEKRSARDLVPGDIVVLEAGSIVPADLRLVETVNLRIQEAALTGESEAVEKEAGETFAAAAPLGDRRNMGYMGTLVTYGRGAGVVIGTGMNTELGKIATLIQGVEQQMTLLQQRLDHAGKVLAVFGVIIAALVMVIGIVRGESASEMFLTAVSVAVAVVPEGLPAVVTVTLALGAQRMLKRRALIRKLPAVETLGSVTVICSDKTGTLTENRMTVTVIDVAGRALELVGTSKLPSETGRNPAVNLSEQPAPVGVVLAGGALCNDASLVPDPVTGKYAAVGDPTEGALLVAASQAGLRKADLETALPRVAELPFDSDRQRMSTVHQLPADRENLPHTLSVFGKLDGDYVAITKGSVDGLLDLATCLWVDDRIVPLDDIWRGRVQAANDQIAQNGMRVLGVALQPLAAVPSKPAETLERDLVFVGLTGMIDPPRPEVRAAVQICRAAGIRPIMITGDHPLTARFIAHDLGISDNGRVKTGQNLDAMTPDEFDAVIKEVSVFARVTPEHKLRIVEALQKQGHVVAMTGDGVNDSPALKKADIGVAMGITGTDVSKEAAQMVLLDDNFATIVAAVEEGRVIYDNLRRFIKFSIAGNVGKVIVMLFAPLFGIAVGLLPLQLLWLNLLTDGLLGLGLGVEPAEKHTMQRPPRSKTESLFSGGMGAYIARVGLLIGVVALGIGAAYYHADDSGDKTWQTMIFTTLAFLQIGQALASRSTDESLFTLGLRSNPLLLFMAVLVFGLQLVAVYMPFFDEFFKIEPLSAAELALSIALGSLAFVGIEIEKWALRRREGYGRALTEK